MKCSRIPQALLLLLLMSLTLLAWTAGTAQVAAATPLPHGLAAHHAPRTTHHAKPEALPQPLRSLMSTTSATFDLARQRQMHTARVLGRRVALIWKFTRRSAREAGISRAVLRRIDAAVHAIDRAAREPTTPLVLAHAANELTAYFAALEAPYRRPTPPAFQTLFYLGRAITLDARARKFRTAAAHRARFIRAWRPLRTRLRAKNATYDTDRVDAALRGMKAAIAGRHTARLARAADRALDGMSAVEKLWPTYRAPVRER